MTTYDIYFSFNNHPTFLFQAKEENKLGIMHKLAVDHDKTIILIDTKAALLFSIYFPVSLVTVHKYNLNYNFNMSLQL